MCVCVGGGMIDMHAHTQVMVHPCRTQIDLMCYHLRRGLIKCMVHVPHQLQVTHATHQSQVTHATHLHEVVLVQHSSEHAVLQPLRLARCNLLPEGIIVRNARRCHLLQRKQSACNGSAQPGTRQHTGHAHGACTAHNKLRVQHTHLLLRLLLLRAGWPLPGRHARGLDILRPALVVVAAGKVGGGGVC